MNISNYIKKQLFEPAHVHTVRHYRQSIKPHNCVLFLHGKGERGPADGSKLSLVEKLAGFPQFAKGTRPGEATSRGSVEYAFDVYAPQVVAPDYTYKEIMYSIVPWLEKYFGYRNIIIVGISMGGYGAYDILKNYTSRHTVKAVVNIAGSADLSEVASMVKIPGLAFHGDADDVVGYAGHKKFIDAYNAAGGNIELVTLPGVKHNAWDYAFNVDPAKDKVLAFVNKIFSMQESSAQVGTGLSVADFNLAIDKAVAALSAHKK